MTRSFSFGKPPEDYERIYNIVLEAQLNALSKLYAGISGSDGCELAKEVFRRYGLEEYFLIPWGIRSALTFTNRPGFLQNTIAQYPKARL